MYHKIMESLDADAEKFDIYETTANPHIEDISLDEYFRNKGADQRSSHETCGWFGSGP